MHDIRIAGAKKRPIAGDPDAVEAAAAEGAGQPKVKKPLSIARQHVSRGTRKKKRADVYRPGDAGYTPHVHPATARQQPVVKGGVQYLSSTNIYGLTSRSERFFPEAYRPIMREFWREIPDEERNQLISIQATAMKKVGYRERVELPREQTRADELYEEATSRRYSAMRRRLSKKPRNYEERKKYEEEKRKAPLERRYIERELQRLDDTPFYKAGPLDTPVLINIKRGAKQPLKTPIPKKLKIKPPEKTKIKIELPQISTAGSPKLGIQRWNNAFGLRSRAVADYPEAFQEVSSVFWRRMSEEQQAKVMLVQAAAMEKVGFERGTDKHFIEDFDPSLMNRYGIETTSDTDDTYDKRHKRAKLTKEMKAEARRQGISARQYAADDENVSLQSRFGDEQFQREAPPRMVPVSLHTGLILIAIGSFTLITGINNWGDPLMTGIGILALICGAMFCFPLRRQG